MTCKSGFSTEKTKKTLDSGWQRKPGERKHGKSEIQVCMLEKKEVENQKAERVKSNF